MPNNCKTYNGYTKMVALKVMTLSNDSLANYLKPDHYVTLSNKKKLPWSLSYPAKFVGWANLFSVDKEAVKPQEWYCGFILSLNIKEPVLNKLAPKTLRNNVQRVLKTSLDTWSNSIKSIKISSSIYKDNQFQIGCLLLVPSNPSKATTNKYSYKYVPGILNDDPVNRIYSVVWEVFTKYPQYLLKGIT